MSRETLLGLSFMLERDSVGALNYSRLWQENTVGTLNDNCLFQKKKKPYWDVWGQPFTLRHVAGTTSEK
jgi:hypothetical protein